MHTVEGMMQALRRRWYLLPSPLLGPASWLGAAKALEDLGHATVIADPSMTSTADRDHITPWIDDLIRPQIPQDDLPVVIVGHSAACPRVPLVADRLLEEGWDIDAIICVDGRFPDGSAFTVSEPTYGPMLDGLVRPDDYLPPWPRWWGSLVEGLVVDAVARDLVFSEARPIPRSLFDQPCPVPELPAAIGRAFLSFGPGYLQSCKRAADEGWLTYRLAGDHLHQVVAPEAVAATLEAMVNCLSCGGSQSDLHIGDEGGSEPNPDLGPYGGA
jgi:hypothetical protein